MCAIALMFRQLHGDPPPAGSDTGGGNCLLTVIAHDPFMSPRNVFLGSVCAAFLAASAAVSGAADAAKADVNADLASSAYKALTAGDPATAIASYTKAIESRQLEPEVLANALLNRGLAYQRLNQHDLAVADYTAALRIDAMSAKLRAMALYNRGLSFQRLDQQSRAAEDFTSALFLDQQFSHAYYSRGVVLRDTGQYLFALADFERALQFKYPDAARVYFGEALAYDALKRPSDARAALTAALAANPQYEPARARLAALDGNVPPKPASGSSDQLETSSIANDSSANGLPKAAAPSQTQDAAGIEASQGASSKKTYYDRVPTEDAVAQAAPAQSGEQQVAIEPVSDTPSQSDGVAGEAAYAGGSSAAATAETASAETSGTAEQKSLDPAAADAPTLDGWAVQVASAASEDGAWTTFKNIQARHPVLSGRKPIVIRADLGAKGTFYRVRFTGFDNQASALSECSKLKSKGVSCFVSKAAS
jgi:tetratricopeptide (TPR) repeat protein